VDGESFFGQWHGQKKKDMDSTAVVSCFSFTMVSSF
jgi:hypothetical protein